MKKNYMYKFETWIRYYGSTTYAQVEVYVHTICINEKYELEELEFSIVGPNGAPHIMVYDRDKMEDLEIKCRKYYFEHLAA